MKKAAILYQFALGMMLASCEIDAYDKGEGDYSLLTADLVTAHVDGSKLVDYVVTDEDLHLSMTPPVSADWIETADTIYRAMLYYNVRGDSQAEAVSFGRVGVLTLRDTIRGGLKTDPLYTESMWISKNRQYLNLRLRVMTGATSDEHAKHVIGLLRDTVASTSVHTVATLYHDQGGQPAHYSAVTYASLPLTAVTTDSLTLIVNTFNGTVSRSFALK